MKKRFALFLLAVMLTLPAWAAKKTVTLYVPGMTCPACPITVKKALSRVDGVKNIKVAFEKREAIVTFDDSKASAQTLIQATKNAGYPSSVVGVRHGGTSP